MGEGTVPAVPNPTVPTRSLAPLRFQKEWWRAPIEQASLQHRSPSFLAILSVMVECKWLSYPNCNLLLMYRQASLRLRIAPNVHVLRQALLIRLFAFEETPLATKVAMADRIGQRLEMFSRRTLGAFEIRRDHKGRGVST